MILLNKTETKRMVKVKSDLKDIFDNGYFRKYDIVPYTAKEIAMCYDCLVDDVTHSTATISMETKTFFEKRGFLIEDLKTNSGWNIYISERVKKICGVWGRK